MSYAQPSEIRRQVAQILRPKARIPVAEAGAKYVRIGMGGNSSKPWSADVTPYMIEPMNCLGSRLYHTVSFVGPARTGKTQGLLDCWLGYIVKCDPGDTMIIHTSQDAARDYSRRRVDRLFRHSPDLRGCLATYGHADNTFDKTMTDGTILSIGWPTIRQLSSRDIKNIAITDYDRGPEDIDGEGDKYTLAQKRTETFLSAGMTLVESSPGHDWSNPKWTPQTPHELPPSPGIVTIYNRGDRRRYCWQCLECAEWFIPSFELLTWRTTADPARSAETVALGCPHCGSVFEPKTKREFNLKGLWLKEGQSIDASGEISGDGRKSRIASFHMTGVMAAFQTWESLVYKFLVADQEYERSGDEMALRGTVLLDQGVPYKAKKRRVARSASELTERAEVWQKLTVPDGVRFLLALIDIQKNRFVVQVMGYAQGRERWLIDRYNIAKSNRDGQSVDPGAYAEDWDLLIPLITKRYELADGSGRFMQIHAVGCDSGGADGVTTKAYDFWRKLQRDPALKAHRLNKRFWLIKGDGRKESDRVKLTHPDTSGRADRGASVGDVPVLRINTNMLKTDLDHDLRRTVSGAGYYHFPDWIGDWWYDELTREEPDEKGLWSAKSKNEAWDLSVYGDALFIHVGAGAMNWLTPKAWAAPLAANSNVYADDQPQSAPVKIKSNRARRGRHARGVAA